MGCFLNQAVFFGESMEYTLCSGDYFNGGGNYFNADGMVLHAPYLGNFFFLKIQKNNLKSTNKQTTIKQFKLIKYKIKP